MTDPYIPWRWRLLPQPEREQRLSQWVLQEEARKRKAIRRELHTKQTQVNLIKRQEAKARRDALKYLEIVSGWDKLG